LITGPYLQIKIVAIGINAKVKLNNIEFLNGVSKLVSKYFVSPTIGSINVKKELHVDSPTTNSIIEDTIAKMMIRIEGFMCLLLTYNFKV
jgi:hypothetical protein